MADSFASFMRKKYGNLPAEVTDALALGLSSRPRSARDEGGSWGSDSGYREARASSGGGGSLLGGLIGGYVRDRIAEEAAPAVERAKEIGGNIIEKGSQLLADYGLTAGGESESTTTHTPSRYTPGTGGGAGARSGFPTGGAIRGPGYMPGVDYRQGQSVTPRAVPTYSIDSRGIPVRTFSEDPRVMDRSLPSTSTYSPRTSSARPPTGASRRQSLSDDEFADEYNLGQQAQGLSAVPINNTNIPYSGFRTPRGSRYGEQTAATGKGAYENAMFDQLADSISRAEGTTKHGYNTMYGGGYKDFSKMTLNEVQSLQKDFIRDKGASPMGKFQINHDTLYDHAKRLGMDMDKTYFTPDVQNKLMLSIAQVQGIEPPVFDGFRHHPKELNRAKKAWAQLKKQPGFVPPQIAAIPPAITPGTVALYKKPGVRPGMIPGVTIGTHGSAPHGGGGGGGAVSLTREQGGSRSEYGGGYGGGGGFGGGGTYGGSGGSNIKEGIGGAFRNR